MLETDGKHVPQGLHDRDLWVLWEGQSKVALAPWQEDSMYPFEWAAAKNVDPRRGFEAVRMLAELPVEELHRTWPFPDGDDLPDAVQPAVLLRHDPTPPPVAFVDFDGVRDSTTGEVPAEAPLECRGSVEIYDHARFTGGTWRHVEDTPPDAIPHAGDVLAEITARYGRNSRSARVRTV